MVGIIFEFCLKNWPISKKESSPSEVNFWSYGKKRVLSIFSIETLIRMQVVVSDTLNESNDQQLEIVFGEVAQILKDYEWVEPG